RLHSPLSFSPSADHRALHSFPTRRSSDLQGPFSFSQICPRCGGSGWVVDKPCPTCGGGGAETRTREVKVRIPVGVADGQRVRVRSEEHTSELQSRFDLVCRLLLEKKKKHI